ncbi:MAG: hypothetical protein GJU77_04535 [Ferrovum sp.]|jgi:hypothetical protein|nr:hypothetical protein [Ferrovum sp.]NDU90563.1 hypothetical protein [Ferrovum sp.]
METQEAYKQKMAAQLKEWNAQIGLLEAELETATADMKVKRISELDALRAKHRVASEKLKEVGRASGEAWTVVKVSADKIWNELKDAMNDIHSKFR